MLSTLTADHLQIKNGTISITSPGQTTPAVYQQLNAELTNVSPTASSPFKLSAQIPGGGSLTGDGTAGPINQANASATPLNAHIAISHLDLASSGIVPAEDGIAGIANVDLKALSDGKNLNANVSANVQGLRVAKNGSPSPKPVIVQLSVVAERADSHRPAPTGRHQHRQSSHQRLRHLSNQRPHHRHQSQSQHVRLHRSTSSRPSFPPSAFTCPPARASRAEPSPPISTSPAPPQLPSSAAPSASTTPTSPALTSAQNSAPSARSPESSPDRAQPSSRSARMSPSMAATSAPTTSQSSSLQSAQPPAPEPSAQPAHSTTTSSSNSPAWSTQSAVRVAPLQAQEASPVS